MSWTKEQKAAINIRGHLLVAAAAGSGKTAVLVERLIQKISDSENPIDVDKFLVVTFTRAAANEMKERIGTALENALFNETDAIEAGHLSKQLTLLQHANITTLHSFCLELLRQFFFQLELDPSFRVADEEEVELLRQDIIEEIFERHYQEGDLDFLNLVEAFGSDRDDSPLMEEILNIYKFSFSQIHPQSWLKELSKAYQWKDVESLGQSLWGRAVKQGIIDQVNQSKDLLARALNIAKSPEGPLHYVDLIESEIEQINSLIEAILLGDWKNIESCFSQISFARLPQKKSSNDCENNEINLREKTKNLREEAKKALIRLKNNFFSWPFEEQLPALANMAKLVASLGDLVLEFADEYDMAKRMRNIVDFLDLEHMTLKLLGEGSNSSIREIVKSRYYEVLVDEYQDINPVQEKIIELVAPHFQGISNLFMVGDVKQSIYRFRMADPTLFLKKYIEFPHFNAETDNTVMYSPGMVIDLSSNFRSRREIIDGVNFIFQQIMTEKAGEISYDEKAALKYGASFISNESGLSTAEGPIEVHLFDKKEIKILNPKKDTAFSHENETDVLDCEFQEDMNNHEIENTEEGINNEELEAARIEARLVANRIQQMIMGDCTDVMHSVPEFNVFDKNISDFRPVRYSDIVILMRSYSALAPIYIEELQNTKIPVYAETKSGYFQASEIETMISLLQIIDNPRKDISLAAVLRSPLVGLDGIELGKLRSALPKGDFFEAVSILVWAASANKKDLNDSCEDNFQSLDEEIEGILSAYKSSLPEMFTKSKEILKNAPELEAKLIKFWNQLKKWRDYSRRNSLADLLWLIYEETGFQAYVGTLPGGEQRQANLKVLYDRACRFEATHYRGLFRFLRFLEKFRDHGKDMGSARTLGENENVVRIMTVHASKGLEFPVVFVVGLGTQFNKQSLNRKLLMHSQLGIGIPIVDIDKRIQYPSFIRNGVKQLLENEMIAEEMRVLYVALTRAKEKLILFGGLGKLEDTIARWNDFSDLKDTNILIDTQLRSAKCFLEWIGPVLARHPKELFLSEVENNSSDDKTQISHNYQGHSSKWKIIVHNVLELSENNKNTTDEQFKNHRQSDAIENNSEIWFEEIKSRLSWKYPYLEEVNQVAKTSVSEIKRNYLWYTEQQGTTIFGSDTRIESIRPQFIQSNSLEITPAERGIVFHTIMQMIPLAEWSLDWPSSSQKTKNKMLSNFLQWLVSKDFLTKEQLELIDLSTIRLLLDSSFGQRLLNSNKILREVPFTLNVELKSGVKPVMVQGVIDAIVFNSEGRIELIDYKTDYFRSDDFEAENKLRRRYILQMSLYAHALERLLKTEIDKCTIYSFSLGKEINLERKKLQDSLKEFSISSNYNILNS